MPTDESLGITAQCWRDKETEHKVMDVELAFAFARRLDEKQALIDELQDSLMQFDPQASMAKPYPSHSEQYRKYHGKCAWLYNPWTSKQRDARDVGSDIYGLMITN